jgi:hypothetical protein
MSPNKTAIATPVQKITIVIPSVARNLLFFPLTVFEVSALND